MQLAGPASQPIHDEFECLKRFLPLSGADVLELGCGDAQKTRLVASRGGAKRIVAAEIDSSQHAKNLASEVASSIEFKPYGAESIPEPTASFDIVLMFKSLHHVPENEMDRALGEIARVLRPGGLAYFSEPVFDGPFNEIMRVFHDEEHVRQAAFKALQHAVARTEFDLVEEYFFKNVLRMESFSQYQTQILGVTHTDHQLSESMLAEVRRRFESHRSPDGYVFEIPNRVDLLRRVGS